MSSFRTSSLAAFLWTVADNYRRSLAAQTPEQFASSQKQFLSTMVTAPDKVAAVAALTGMSNPATTGQAMSELLCDDLRPRLDKIQCPVLVLASLVDALQMGYPREAAERIYRNQYRGLPQTRFAFFDQARRFIMVDDPLGFNAAVKMEFTAPRRWSAVAGSLSRWRWGVLSQIKPHHGVAPCGPTYLLRLTRWKKGPLRFRRHKNEGGISPRKVFGTNCVATDIS